MKKRLITAAALFVLLGVVIWQIYTPVFIAVIAAFSALAANEIMKCAKISNKFLLIVGTIIAAIIPLLSCASTMEPLISTDVWFKVINFIPRSVIITAVLLSYMLAMLKGYSHTKFEDVAIAAIASLAVPYAFSLFGVMRDLLGYQTQFGIYLVFYGLIAALGTDSGAQLGGMAFGKTKMAPNISPKKTVEGAACGIVFGFILNGVALTLYNKLGIVPIPKNQAAILLIASPFIQFMGMMGDLSASVLKRNFDVKDFGWIFPGHGGVMDRFDSSLFTIPLTYCLAVFFL